MCVCVLFVVAELNDKGAWTALRYVDNFNDFAKFTDTVDRINVNDVSCDEFIERYEKIYKPVIITGVQVNIWFAAHACVVYVYWLVNKYINLFDCFVCLSVAG